MPSKLLGNKYKYAGPKILAKFWPRRIAIIHYEIDMWGSGMYTLKDLDTKKTRVTKLKNLQRYYLNRTQELQKAMKKA